MNQTTYRSRIASPVASPYQLIRKEMSNVHSEEHPVQKEVRRIVGSYPLTIEVAEDTQTLQTLKHIPGLIAFVASVKKDGQIIGQGRGSSVISRLNKFVERTVRMSFNGSIISAVMHATKALDVLADPLDDMSIESVENVMPEKITDKQRSYLTTLVQKNVHDESTLTWWMNEIANMDTKQASDAIKSFVKN